MPDASQFTLGLFGNTALGWSVATPQGACTQPVDAGPDNDQDEPAVTAASQAPRGRNLCLDSDRSLARGWVARARDNITAIRVSKELEATGRPPTSDEQQQLIRFVGFGASELAQNAFPLPGETSFRDGWEEMGRELAALATPEEYAALQRATQYAHYTPEPVVRSLWQAAQHLGFNGGHVLEPGMGTGLFFALLPEALRDRCRLTGVEYDPITARIARLVHPETQVRCEDYTRSLLGGGFDLVIGNPPFADRIVRADPTTAGLGLRLHDYFIARSIARLRPGGLALFVTSTGTMDKSSTTAREHIASLADLIGGVRLPEGSMRATAGTDVVVDILAFQRRAEGQATGGSPWLNLVEVSHGDRPGQPGTEVGTPSDMASMEVNAPENPGAIAVNEYFAAHPEMVLGVHAQRRGIYGPQLTYTCRAVPDARPLEERLAHALQRLPASIYGPSPEPNLAEELDEPLVRAGTAADGATIKEGSYLVGKAGRLMQIVGGVPEPVAIREGKGGDGIPVKSAKIIRALLPIRDAVREVLRAQAANTPWAQAQVKLRVAYSGFIRYFGPINHTVISVTADAETGEERETHRRPNLAPFADDPDCWLVASIESYDLETGLARKGPIFSERVIAPPAAPVITSAADALAVTLADTGRVDLEHLADLIERDHQPPWPSSAQRSS